jgi:hypothetical protein
MATVVTRTPHCYIDTYVTCLVYFITTLCHYVAFTWLLNEKLQVIGNGHGIRHFHRVCPEGSRETAKYLSD